MRTLVSIAVALLIISVKPCQAQPESARRWFGSSRIERDRNVRIRSDNFGRL